MKFILIEEAAGSISRLTDILSPFAKIEVASNSSQIFRLFSTAVQTGEYFRLILININMKEIDVPEFFLHINRLEKSRNLKKTIKIAISSECNARMVKLSREIGCDAFLVKPIHKETIIQKLKKFELIKNQKTEDSQDSDNSESLIPDEQSSDVKKNSDMKKKKRKLFRKCGTDRKMKLFMEAIVLENKWRIRDE
ncbi:MAG: hypothetical protein K8S56_02480 [Candidatus Cloacimonetes bacterium]|nr:hypothetical protein [Candidatus Cloacimonadota bacterium]